MRIVSRSFAHSLFAVVLVGVAAVVSAQAQNREQHVISARAGGVNFVAGDCRVQRAGETDWRTLTAKDDLGVGDILKTGAGGQVEVLLNPGTYLRLAENSEFALMNDALDSLRLKLAKGSAVVEATGFSELQVTMTIETPQTEVSIIRSGIYRLNVSPSNVTEVSVEKGRATVGRGETTTLVKGGKSARVDGAGVEVAKLDKKNRDALDLWSKERGKLLAQANNKLPSRNINSLLASDWFNDYWGTQRNAYSGNARFAGFWFYNPRMGMFTFVPLYYGWGSPYGGGYNNSLIFRDLRFCPYCQQPPNNGSTINLGQGTGVGSGAGGGTGSGGGAGAPNNPAPVRQVDMPVREISRPSFEQPRPIERPAPRQPRDQ